MVRTCKGLKIEKSMGIPKLVTVVVILSWISIETNGYSIGNNPHHRAAYLDTQGMYYLEWEVDWAYNLITFNISVGTNGYILFGLANNGSATTGADIIIGGVDPHGRPYFSDRHTLRDEIPQPDTTGQKDYVLHDAWENRTHTTLSFSRLLDTCDRFDYPITGNKVTVIWGYGVTDDYELVRNYGVQGAYSIHLTDPEYAPRISRDRRLNGQPSVVTRDNLQVWTIRRQIIIPTNSTSYICSVHKAPRLPRKHHMVGFDIYFHSQGSRRRTHHVVIYKCNAPGLGDPRPIFEPIEGGQGQRCVIPQRPPTSGPIPTHLCSQLYMAWAVGGRSFFTPPRVGQPFGEQPHEYYMVQAHYDNPQQRSGQVVDMRLDFFYTGYLRDNDAGILGMGHENPALTPALLLPPQTTEERIFGHCVGECMRRILPPGGIRIYAVMLHTHNSGRRTRLRHFRGDQELPWIQFDDNYSNTYQQNRHLKEEVRVLPGDQLTMECIYDNTWTNGTVVGGYTTTQEMCMAFLFYYNLIPEYNYCRSDIVSPDYRRRFLGVGNITWNEDLFEWVATSPQNLAGLTMTDVSDNYVNWDTSRRQELKRFHEGHPHVGRCSRDAAFRDPAQLQQLLASGALAISGSPSTNMNTPDDYSGPAQYPYRASPYVPQQSCSYKK